MRPGHLSDLNMPMYGVKSYYLPRKKQAMSGYAFPLPETAERDDERSESEEHIFHRVILKRN
jgi:hypothetical protein